MEHYDPEAVKRDNRYRDTANNKKFNFVMKNMRVAKKIKKTYH